MAKGKQVAAYSGRIVLRDPGDDDSGDDSLTPKVVHLEATVKNGLEATYPGLEATVELTRDDE